MINQKKILLTGVNSIISNYISKKLNKQKFQLYGLTSSRIVKKKYYQKIARIDDYDFLKNVIPQCEFIIHVGWNRNSDNKDNLKLYNKLLKYKNKKAKIIFFSTVAATPNAISNYGKTKYKLSNINLKNKNINLFIGLVDYKFSNHIRLLNKIFNFKLFQLRFTKNIFNVYYVKIETLVNLIIDIIEYKKIKSNFLVVDKIFKLNDFLDLCDNNKKFKIYIPYLLSIFFIKIIQKIKTKNTLIDKIKTFTHKDEKFLYKIK